MDEVGSGISLNLAGMAPLDWAKNVEQILANPQGGDNAIASYNLEKLLREYIGEPENWGRWSIDKIQELAYQLDGVFTQQQAAMQNMQNWALEYAFNKLK